MAVMFPSFRLSSSMTALSRTPLEDDKQWTLMPGFGNTAEEPLWYDSYLHPYRITNVYGMLADLELVPELGAVNGEAENE